MNAEGELETRTNLKIYLYKKNRRPEGTVPETGLGACLKKGLLIYTLSPVQRMPKGGSFKDRKDEDT